MGQPGSGSFGDKEQVNVLNKALAAAVIGRHDNRTRSEAWTKTTEDTTPESACICLQKWPANHKQRSTKEEYSVFILMIGLKVY